jgi:predicted TIM-barrel fold metal-dependent hydrolase
VQIVDTHAHIYHPDEMRYPKIVQPLRPPDGTGDVDHLRCNMERAGVARAVLVQTGTAYDWDNRLLADTAQARSEWAVGVCTVNPAAGESVAELERLVTGYNVRGLRMEPTRGEHPTFDHPGARRLWEATRYLDIVLCAHIRRPFLGQLATLLSDYPDVPVVLDHAAYPQASEGVDSETVTGVVELADYPNLYLKLTFAVTGSDQAYPFRDMHPILTRLIQAYGPQRCMWGSDSPCELWLRGKATYQNHLSLFTEILDLSEGERRAILEETPTRLWFRAKC